MLRFNQKEFLSSGTWTCPAGVTTVLVWGMGGGAGGGGGQNGTSAFGGSGGYGGGGTVLQPAIIDVVPNTTYTITIGDGGAGGLNQSRFSQEDNARGDAGGNTTFGGLFTWYGAPRRKANSSIYSQYYIDNTSGIWANENANSRLQGTQASPSGYSFNGTASYSYHGLRGSNGSAGASFTIGGNGSAGCSGEAAGGSGGSGGTSGNPGANGSNAPANSGAGGGGGGGGGSGTQNGGVGGNGGSGKMIIIWSE